VNLKRAMLLVGSPRGVKSNSHSLGTYLMGRLEDRRVKTTTWFTQDVIKSEDKMEEFLEELDGSDLIVMAFPLYVDSIPAMNIRLMEIIADHRKGSTDQKRFMGIVNSGFPEKEQNETALRICRQFSREANMEWTGGLALGGGMVIGARPLKEIGGMVRNITKAIDMAAADLVRGNPISMDAKGKMKVPFSSRFVFSKFANRFWKKMANSNGVRERIDDRPYERE